MAQNEKNSSVKQKPLLLFSPLDWGLGHLTRSIPILKEFQTRGWQIVVACNSTQKNLLQSEIYGLQFVMLKGYNVHYGRNKLLTRLKLTLQLINILMRIKWENRWLRSYLDRQAVDLVLSDNRYGFFSTRVPSVFITHQLRPITGLGSFADNLIQQFLYRYINRFSRCWVPDNHDTPALAGALSHPTSLPRTQLEYIGPLSRLKAHTPESNSSTERVLILLSGPEPQRTILENIISSQLAAFNTADPSSFNFTLVRGLPGIGHRQLELPGVQSHDHAGAQKLNGLVIDSDLIVCRSGYTTLMDMIKLKKKMILIPTPGQTEQEYLGKYFMNNHFAICFEQRNFSLQHAIEAAKGFPYHHPAGQMENYKHAVAAADALIRGNKA